MNAKHVQLAAKAIVVILFLLGVFQVALILGAPLGHFAWGGQYRVLPSVLRVGSASSLVLYVIFSLIILDRAKVVDVFRKKKISYVGAWILTGYSAIGILMNAASRSHPERYVQTPVVAILFLLMLYVAKSAKNS